MKKRLNVLLCIMLMVMTFGCQKKETASDIMQKVFEHQKTAVSLEMNMNVEGLITLGNDTFEVPMAMKVQMDYPNDITQSVMKMEMSTETMGVSIQTISYLSDGTIYNDVNGVKTKETMDKDYIDNLVNQMSGMQVGDASLYQGFTVNENESGYLIYGSLSEQTISSMSESLVGQLMNGNETFADAMELITIESYEMEVQVSKDYHLMGYTAKAQMSIDEDSQTMKMVYTYDADIKLYDQPQVSLPNLTDWDIQRMACAFDSSSEVLYFEAKGEELQSVGSSYWFRYEDYGITTKAQKEEFNSLLKEMYEAYEGEGLTLNLQIEEDEVIVTLLLDYQNASDEALSVLSLSRGLTYSMMLLATEELDCTKY